MIWSFSFIIDVSGYVSCVTPTKVSSKRNNYFDVEIQTSPNQSRKVRIMETQGTKRAMFLKRCEDKSPLKLTRLSVTKNLSFFNCNTGSRVEDVKGMNFVFSENSSITEVKDISTEISGCLTILGQVQWVSDAKDLEIGPNKVPKQVRDGLFGDESGIIPISVWGDLIEIIKEKRTFQISKVAVAEFQGVKLQTTSSSEATVDDENKVIVDWSEAPSNVDSSAKKLVKGEIVSFTLNRYATCINSNCGKKVYPLPGDCLVKCHACQCKMKILSCKSVISGNLLLQEDAGNQHELVIFQNVISDQFNNQIPDQDGAIEEHFLNLEQVSVLINKNVVISLEDVDVGDDV